MHNPAHVLNTVAQHDLLGFWNDQELDYTKVREFLEFDRNDLSKIAKITKSSVRYDDRIPPALKNRMMEIANICNLVSEYFEGNPDKTALWFKTKNPSLGGVSPKDMLRFGRYRKLLDFILQAKEANQAEG